MTILAVTLALAFVAMYVRSEVYANRCANLEIHIEGLRDEIVELVCKLDDAQREAARLRVTQDYLIRENTTLLTDLMHTERICQYYRSRRRRNKEAALSLYLLGGAARPNKKAHLMAMESRP